MTYSKACRRGAFALSCAALSLGGCALQPAYQTPDAHALVAWSSPTALMTTPASGLADDGWHALGDSAINTMAEAAFADSFPREGAFAHNLRKER